MIQQLFTSNSDCHHVFHSFITYVYPIQNVCTLCVYVCCECVRVCVTVFLFVFLAAALALCKYSLAEWNATDASANRTVSTCPRHGNGDNCTDTIDTGQWNGHFSKCPEDLTHYCVHGECRYIEEQKAPSCSNRDLTGFFLASVGVKCFVPIKMSGEFADSNYEGSGGMLCAGSFNFSCVFNATNSSSADLHLSPSDRADQAGDGAAVVRITISVIYSLVCALGLVGNLLVLYLMKSKQVWKKSSINLFVTSLAVTDFQFVLTLPFWAVENALDFTWLFGRAMCKIVSYVTAMNMYASVFFLTAMSVA
ncbi:hypothetical protein L3Q82_012538, partial [Scortum barcoo]